MNFKQLHPIRLEIALALVDSTHQDAKKVLAGIAKTDPAIATVLKEYGVEV